MVCCGCSFLQVQKNWFCSLLLMYSLDGGMKLRDDLVLLPLCQSLVSGPQLTENYAVNLGTKIFQRYWVVSNQNQRFVDRSWSKMAVWHILLSCYLAVIVIFMAIPASLGISFGIRNLYLATLYKVFEVRSLFRNSIWVQLSSDYQ